MQAQLSGMRIAQRLQFSSEGTAELKKRMQWISVGCRVAHYDAANSLAVCSIAQGCSVIKKGASKLRGLQSTGSSLRCSYLKGQSSLLVVYRLAVKQARILHVFSQVVGASGCQCQSRNSPGFDPSILRHSGIWGAADDAVLNNVHKKK